MSRLRGGGSLGRAGLRARAGRFLLAMALVGAASACGGAGDEEDPPASTTTATALTQTGIADDDNTTTTVATADAGEAVPDELGDDPVLDALWRDCESGSGEACDELFRQSPVGSAYEEFGYSCGDRPEVVVCADLDGEAG